MVYEIGDGQPRRFTYKQVKENSFASLDWNYAPDQDHKVKKFKIIVEHTNGHIERITFRAFSRFESENNEAEAIAIVEMRNRLSDDESILRILPYKE